MDILSDIHIHISISKIEICHCIYQHAKANNKYMKDYDKNKESSYLQDRYVNNLYGWAMLQKSPINNFG